MGDWKTIRVPKDAWETAQEQRDAADRTWGEQIVRPVDGDNGVAIPEIDAQDVATEVANELLGGVGDLEPYGGEVPDRADETDIIGRIDDLEVELKRVIESLGR